MSPKGNLTGSNRTGGAKIPQTRNLTGFPLKAFLQSKEYIWKLNL